MLYAITIRQTDPSLATPPPPVAVNGNYLYDGNMKRVRSVVNGKTIYNVYALEQVGQRPNNQSVGLIISGKGHGSGSGTLTHVDAVTDNKKTDYISKVARISNGVITYLHPDHLGSAVSGTTSTGAMAWTERYTPFGETMLSPTANDNLDGYTGHIKDAATGLNYMQARYYDPALGRFLSIDPVGFTPDMPFMFGRYTYVGNDPVNAWDPDGAILQFVVAAGACSLRAACRIGVGAVVGAVVGGGASLRKEITDGIPGVNLGNVAIDSVGGAVAGAVVGLKPGVKTAAAAAGISGAVGSSIKDGINGGKSPLQAAETAIRTGANDAIAGALGARIGPLAGQGFPADGVVGTVLGEVDVGLTTGSGTPIADSILSVEINTPRFVPGTALPEFDINPTVAECGGGNDRC